MSADTAPAAYRLPPFGQLRNWAEVAIVYAGLLAMVVAAPAFHTTQNLENVLRQSIVLGLASIGQTFVLLSGGIDFSVGSIVKLNVLVGALLLNGQDGNIPLAVAVVLPIGAGIGLANGLLITRLNAVPFIVTFGAFFLVRGIALNQAGRTDAGVDGRAVQRALAWLAISDHEHGFGLSVCLVGSRAQAVRPLCLRGRRARRSRRPETVLRWRHLGWRQLRRRRSRHPMGSAAAISSLARWPAAIEGC